MDLVHCIYCSAARDPNLSQEGLDAILEHSRLNNAKRGVTGMLLYDSGAFFQVLEGDRAQIEALYERIESDPRHHHVTKLITEPIEQRDFGSWSMGYPRVTTEDLKRIPGLNDFFAKGFSFRDLEPGRAKTLLAAFKQGKWRV